MRQLSRHAHFAAPVLDDRAYYWRYLFRRRATSRRRHRHAVAHVYRYSRHYDIVTATRHDEQCRRHAADHFDLSGRS